MWLSKISIFIIVNVTLECLLICIEIIANNIWHDLPPPPFQNKLFTLHKTHAIFSSLYEYVSDLHLWHTKAEKQSYKLNQWLYDRLRKMQVQKTKFLSNREPD